MLGFEHMMSSPSRIFQFCDHRNEHKIKQIQNFSTSLHIFCRVASRHAGLHHQNMNLAKALFDSCAFNLSTTMIESNKMYVFTGMSLKESCAYHFTIWSSLKRKSTKTPVSYHCMAEHCIMPFLARNVPSDGTVLLRKEPCIHVKYGWFLLAFTQKHLKVKFETVYQYFRAKTTTEKF